MLGNESKFKEQGTVQCQLFGLDILSDDTLQPRLIEINKGPEMAWSSEQEQQYKKKLAIDMFNLLGYVESDVNEFIPLLTMTR